MKKSAILIHILITVVILFSFTVSGQNNSNTGSLLNKRYPTVTKVTKGTSSRVTSRAPLASISVNEDPVFNAMTPSELVQNAFITGCLQANNVKFGYYKKSGSSWNWTDHVWAGPNNRQMGYFKKGTSTFPIEEGIILTTGIASSAMGPNDTEGKSDLMVPGASDPDLSLISGQDMNDAAVLEFDFVPAGNTMEFKYTFSSEEYLEYINSAFNDAFGFFLSGPGINGTYQNNAVNLAVLPNGDPVTINTIHPAGTNIGGQSYAAMNDEYYVNNPQLSPTFQFDGGTVVLTATYAVTPCQTYHIKLCVADAFDQEFDGAVFLAAKSFNSENVILTNYGNSIEGLNNIFEGCSDYFRIQRSTPDISHKLSLDLVLSGTATNGVDIKTTDNKPFPNKVDIPANASYVDIPYNAVADGISDNGETFNIKIATSCPCAANVVYVEKALTIYENFAINSITATDALCHNQNNGTITVNTSGGTGNFEFSKNNGTNWQRSNYFTGLAPGTYTILVRDPGSCYGSLSGTATVGNPAAIVANAGSAVTICSGQTTQLTGSGGVLYSWSPASGLSATNISNPIANPSTTTTYTLTASNALGLCSSTSNVTVSVNPSPVAAISQTNMEICKGNSTTLTASGGNTYFWNPGGATTAAITVSPVTTSNYTAIAIAANGCSDSKTVTVTVNDSPSLFNVTGGGSFCAGGSGVAVGLSGSQVGVNYQLKLNGANIGSAIGGNGSAFSFGNQTLPGTYTVEATMESTSCIKNMDGNAIITVDPVPAAPTVGLITQPTCTVSTGNLTLNGLPSGNWILNPGGIAGSGNSYTISGLTAGTYSYTVTNSAGCTSLPSANIVINVQPVTPTAPILIMAIQPTCLVATGSKILGGLPAGNWILNPGTIAGTGSTYTITDLTAGTYAYTVTNAAGCTSLPSNSFTILTQPVTPSAPTVGTITQPTCAISTGSVQLNNLPAGNWTINPGAISGSGASTTISGLTPGTYNYSVTNASGCTSPASANVVIIAAIPETPITGSVIQPTCSVSTGSIVLNGLPAGIWTINPGAISGTGASKTISGLSAGSYSFTVTNAAGCVSLPSNNIIIDVQPVTPTAPTVGVITQPTCVLATGSVVLNNLPAGNWTINPGTITGTGGSKTISGLVSGTYSFTVTNASGCTSSASANVVIDPQPVIPSAPTVGTITEPTCSLSTGSVVLNGLPAGNWTLNPGAIAGNTTTTTLSGLAAGTYTYTVTQGCTSAATANIVINTQPATPSAPTIGTITQPTCSVATGSVVLNGLPAGNWTINPGAISGTGISKTISGLTSGTYTFTVTNASGCTSVASGNVIINSQPVVPTVIVVGAVTQPTCTVATGSVVLNGLPAGNWIINPGTIAGTGGSYTISGIAAGTYSYTVTNTAGCTSSSSINVVINAQPVTPSAPTAGTITQPTCTVATGSIVLNGLPAGNWTLNPGAIAGTGISKTISGLMSGTYNYSVTNSSGCTSLPSANMVINVNPSIPSAPSINTIIQPTCEVATGSVELGGLPAGNWIINPGAIAGSGSTFTISNLVAGTYNYTVTNSVGCISLASANIVIIANAGTPTAPTIGTITQPSCSVSTGSVQLTGLPAGSWTINPGAVSGSGNSTTISGLATGTYTFTVSNGAGCISLASISVVIGTQPITPSAPIVGTITQPTCDLSTGTVVLSGLPAGNWTINPGAVSGIGASKTISGIAPGTYGFTVTNSVGCTSLPSPDVVIVDPTPSTPIVGAVTQPSCSVATGSVVLNGLPSGNWTINPGAIAGTGLSATISGLVTGTYNFTVTQGCTSLPTANVIINTQPVTPSAPTVGVITQPTCAIATGSVVINGLPSGNWTINPGAVAGTGTSKTISNLVAGTYNFTVTNAVGCTSLASANVIINPQPVTPSAPLVSSVTQPTCEVATGSVELAGLPGGNWTINPGAIAGSGSNKIISGLIAGNYNYTVTNSAGCTSSASNNIVIVANPGTPPIPLIGTITQPSCLVSGGSIDLNGLPAGNWILNPGNIAGTGSSTTLTDVITGTHNYTVTNASGCISLPTANIVINTQPITPAVPTLGTITQPTCTVATGKIRLTGLPAGNWTINPGAISGSTSIKTVFGLVPGTYSFTVTNSVGCTSIATADVIINAQPETPSVPTIGIITQPTCSVSTGSVILNDLPSGTWTINPSSISGTGAGTTISDLPAGTHTFTVTNSVGCTSVASENVIINTQPLTPSAPLVGKITQPTCTVATGSVVLNGLPTGNWTINPGAISGTGSSYTLSGLVEGTYTYSVTNAAGCVSLSSANIVINSQPLTPSAPIPGAITQPTCANATGSVILSGLPLGNWTINPGLIAGTGVSYTVSGIDTGTKTYTVTNASGCISAPSANVIINTQPVTPSAPTISSITQPSCSVATGSVVLSGLPAGNWTINPGSISGNTATTTISGLFSGIYNYSVTNSVGCTSALSANIVINTQPSTPSAPAVGTITQPNCLSATGSVLLSGLPTGNWILNPGSITGTGATTTLSGLVSGTYAYTVTNAAGCTSSVSDNIVINPQPPIPTAPALGEITQPTCSVATGNVILNGLPSGNWTINPGAIAGSGSSTTISGLATGTYVYTVTNSVGCNSPASDNVVINTQPLTPTAPKIGIITQPSCEVATGSIVLNALPSGNWTINPGAITGSGSSKTISGLSAGTYAFSVTNASGCTSLNSASVTIFTQPLTPSAPIIGSISQPNCSTATGSVVLEGLPSGNWTIEPGSITGSGTSTVISGLNPGTYSYSVTNSAGCVSSISANIIINLQPETPSAPLAGEITQPECAVLTGSIVLEGLPSGNWTINPGAISGTGPNTTLSNLISGTYSFTVTNEAGCISELSANIVINTQPSVPSTPIIGTITQPTCTNATGSVVLSGLPPRNWIISPGGILGNTSSVTISDLSPGTYVFTVSKIGGCSSLPTGNVVIDPQPSSPPAPTVNTIVQPSCFGSTGTITISAPTGIGMRYSIDGSTYTNTTGIFTMLPEGTYSVTAKNSIGCISPGTSIIIDSPPAELIFALPQITNVSCNGDNNGIIKISASGGTGSISYSISPNTGIQSPNGTFSNLIAQSYSITATDENGCTKSTAVIVGTTTDITVPTITCPNNVTATTNTGCTATGVAIGTPVTADNCGVASVTNNAPAAFPLGVTTVTWTVTDNSGNKASCNQMVTVSDNILPLITPPVNVTTTTNTGCTATGVALGTPVTSDNCGVASVTNNAPAAFPLGVTTVTWTVTDNSGNKATCEQTVTISDNILPTITCPTNVTATTNTGCTATGVVLGTPVTSDNCGVASVTNNASAAFPLGVTTVTWTVTDNSGNKATCEQTVTVSDNILPTITCPTNVTATTNTGCTATGVALGTPVTSDNCGVASVTNNAPAAFPLGVTTVTWTVTDNSGNKATCEQTVTVSDNILPTITCPTNVTATTNTGCTATGVVLDTPVTSDNCGVASVTNNAPAAFPLGVTTVTWTVTDNSGNKATCEQTVTVSDNILPTITCPTNVTATTNTGCTATGVALGTPVTSDNCGVASVTNNAPLAFPLGVTTVTWTVTDNSGNKATCDQTVTVSDNILPTITCPTNVTATTNTGCTATGVVLDTPVTSDNCGVASVTNNAPAAFPLGVTTVTWTVTDNSGNKATCEQTVTVTDNILPTITCPTNVTATTNTSCTATGVALGTPVTSDNCGVASVTNNAPAAFPLGVTTVTWTVTDNSGNKATCDQTVTVSDNILPTITCPTNVTATTNTGCTATGVVLDTPVTSDNCGVASVTNNAPAAFPLGVTTVTWTVTDNSGNKATCEQTVTVTDNILPTIACPTNVTATTNTGCTATGVALGTPVTSDNCGVASVTNNAPAAFPLGVTTVTWTVTDNSGNKATCEQTVTVSDNILPTITCPTNVTTTTNTGCTATGVVLGTPVTSDNCGVASVTNNAPLAFPLGVTTVTWVVTDNSGNKATCDQTVTVSDNKPPIIICPAAISVNANIGFPYATDVILGTPVTSDNCGIASVINDAPVQFPVGSTTVTWTATDVNGLSSSCTQMVIVTDTQSPVMNCPPTITVSCINEVPAAYISLAEYISAGGTVADNDGINVASFSLADQSSNGQTCPEIITRIYTVADINNNFGTCSQQIIVDDKTEPVFTNFPVDVSVQCTSVPSPAIIGTDVTASDNCDPSVAVSFENEVRTNGTCNGSYTLVRTWKAVDACGNSITKSQTIIVQDITAPVINTLPVESTIDCPSVPVFAEASATDACGSDFTLTFNDVTTPGACAGSYSVTRTWTATDACGNTSTASQKIKVQDITAPVIAALPAESTIDCPSVPVFAEASATDACGSDFTLTFNDVTTPGACAGSYSVTRTWTATDACGNTSTASQKINVQDITAPVINALPAESTIDCPSVPVFAEASATDACGSDFTLTFNDVTTPGACAGSYSVTRTWTATDACGNTSTALQRINVQDITAPVINTLPAESTIDCPSVPVFAEASASDACGSDFTLTFNDVTTPGACAGSYSVTRTWSATDACGNTSTASQKINVQDITAPVIAALPAESTIDCPSVPVFAEASATDACGSDFTLTFNDITTPGACAGSYSVTRTWTATDACGNTSTASQKINVQDITAPVINALPAESTIDCPSVPVFAEASATDACGSDFTLTFNDVTTPGACAGSYSVTRTWTAIDACGNTSTASQKINVQDITAPVIAALPAESTIDCPSVPVFAEASATDACGSNFTLTFNDVTTPGACAGSYSVTRTWTATDACGNISNASQTIKVQDVKAPVVTCPSNISVYNDPGVCGATIVVPKPILVYDCSAVKFVNSINQTEDASGLYPVGTTTIQWTLTDECGNTSTCSMAVTVVDNEAPVIICPADIISCSTDQVVLGTPGATDNCGDVTISSNAPSTFDTGITSVVWTATDIHGNSSSCTQTVTITPMVTADAGDDKPVCSGMPFTFTSATATNYTSVSWTHNGQGTLSDAKVVNPTYTPAAGETGKVEFKLTAYGVSGCGNKEKSDFVTLTIYPAITVDAGSDRIIISGTATSLVGTAVGGSGVFSYNWTPEELISSSTNGSLTPNTLALNTETVFTLTVTDALSLCSQSDQVTISVDGTERPIAVDDYDTTGLNTPVIINVTENDKDIIGLGLVVSIIGDPANGIATLDENGFITYTPRQDFSGNDTITYRICDKGTPSKCATARVIITIFPKREAFEIYNLVTPDGDGKNDYWHIGGITDYPDNEVLVFNRWGTKIREFVGYNNSDKRWDCTNEKGESVPDGVYFYILKVSELQLTKTGWVYVRGNH